MTTSRKIRILEISSFLCYCTKLLYLHREWIGIVDRMNRDQFGVYALLFKSVPLVMMYFLV